MGTRSGTTRPLWSVLSFRGAKNASARGSGRLRAVSVVAVVALAVPLGLTPMAHAAPGPLGRPDLPGQRSVKVHTVGPGAKQARKHVADAEAADNSRARRALAEQTTAWPKGGTARIRMAGGTGPTAAGGLPVAVSSTGGSDTGGTAEVTVLDRTATAAAGVRGVLLSVRPQTAGTARLSVGYTSFASAYGGGWSGRLRLVELPGCALTTPDLAECRTQTALASANDLSTQSVSASAPLTTGAGANSFNVFALTAGSGASTTGSGDYTATALSASSKWEAGGSSGSFTWSYAMQEPAATAGPAPSVSVSYDSGSIDGRTASTNNQGSQVGEGFGLSTDSYVSRQYGSCDDDGHADVYDQCWKYDNASLVLNGKSTELVKDDTSGVWRLADDDASTVTQSTGADNGDDDGEYWTVVTGDGTKYVFGLNKLPGAGTERTNSVWTAPVFGDDSGEPGYSNGSAFADRWLTQAWRWNLDYVVDTHGNAETYWYTAETNYYKKNGATTANAKYIRGGHLDKILYGQRSDTLFSATATDQVAFSYEERCFATSCSSLTDATSDNWPDVPFDTICASGASDTDCMSEAPAFFTRKRLTQVQTSVWSGTGTTYTPVDKWVLTQEFQDPGDIGDTSDQTLVLKSVKHTGQTGTTTALDPVSFTYRMLPNRVDATDDILPLNRPRIDTITSETGAISTVSFAAAECVRGSHMPAAEDNDTMSCYPVYWHINGAEDAGLDWFHKYRVQGVFTSDPAAGNEAVEQSYSYADPAWHYDDSPFTPEDERTWSVWRGYGTVTVFSGDSDHVRSKTVTRYMQGMNGDKQKSGIPRSVTVGGISGTGLTVSAVTDSDQYAGFTREQVTYDGSTAVSATVNDPWSSRTATQHKSYADIEAYYIRTGKTYSDTYLTVPAKWRTSSVATTYDSYGMAVKADSAGDTAKSGDETCTRTWYARNDSAGINSLTSRVRTVGAACTASEASLSLPASTATAGDVLADSATVYDSATATAWSATQTPTKGEATWSGRPGGYPASPDANGERYPSSWQTTGRSTLDDLGRVTYTEDAAGTPSTMAYTPTGAGPLTRTIATNVATQKVTTFYDGLRGLPTMVFDVNTKKTELAYDGLGRLTGVWFPNRSKSSESANTTFDYHVSRDAQPYVTTSTLGLNGTRNTSYQIYDALLRPLQTQTPTPTGGRLLTDTRYDSRGLAYETFSGIFDSAGTPNGEYARAEYGGAPTQNEFTFDGAGRTTSDTLLVYGVQKGATVRTTYTGDSTATSARTGGSAARVITDALGRTTERRDYAGTSPADADYGGTAPLPGHTTTFYGYTRDGKPKTVTGPDNTQWSYGYDLFGRQVSATDPDMGTTTTAYTSLDQVDYTQNSAGKTVLYGYDTLGRKTGEWQTSKTDTNKLAAWTYDSVAKGQLASATRYDGGLAGKAYTQKVLTYDSLYHPTQTELDLAPTDPLVTSGVAQSSYTFASAYGVDGSLTQAQAPAVAGLPQEWVSYTYRPTGQIDTVSGASGYLQNVSYSSLGQPQLLTLGTSAATGVKKAYISNEYEAGTGRLTRSSVTDQTHAWMPQDLNYSYDDAGNVTKITDPTTLGGTAQADTQCFGYDGYRRLTSAWTPADANCATTTTGGAAPYSTGYTYNPAGLRLSETQHPAGGTTTTNYCYNDTAHPHAVTATTAAASCVGVTPKYVYDNTGNTTTRPGATGSQTLAWNSEGDLTTTTEGTKSTGYLYDADGNLLLRRASAGGESVLYLGATELHTKTVSGTTKTWATRTYTAGADGPAIAVRSNQSGTTQLSWLVADQHGTSSLAMDATTQAITKRYSTPFGAPRGTAATTWPDDKAFLGQPADTGTGLTHIGAREYDPAIGRFLSIDPLLETDKPQTLNGYTYSANNPATFSDPDGMGVMECMTGALSNCAGGTPTASSTYDEKRDPHSGSSTGSSSASIYTGPPAGPAAPTCGWCILQPYVAPYRPMYQFDFGNLPYQGIIDDPAADNNDMSRMLLYHWLFNNLGSHPVFHGGDAIVTELSGAKDVVAARDSLLKGLSQGSSSGISIRHTDVGPHGNWKGFAAKLAGHIAGPPWDLSGALSNGVAGESNWAEAFIGSYSGRAHVVPGGDKGTIRLQFTIKNTSDWNSATKIIPRRKGSAKVLGLGERSDETFTWTEQWAVGTLHPNPSYFVIGPY